MKSEEILLETENVRVRFSPRPRSDFLVVTFNPLDAKQSKDLPAFGEKLLKKVGISSVHVTTSQNHWYQHTELSALGEILTEVSGFYDKVVTYGSSMGGYAAIKFSGAVKADRVVAISPQFSVDPAKVDYASKYAQFVEGVDFIDDDITSDVSGRILLVYDNRSEDLYHARAIAAHTRVHHIPIPFSGHPTTAYLLETGALTEVTKTLLFGEVHERDLASVGRRATREGRGKSSAYFASLGRLSRSFDRKVRLLTKALELNPADNETVNALGQAYIRNDQLETALVWFRHGLLQKPHNVGMWLSATGCLTRLGRPDEALTMLTNALPYTENSPALCMAIEKLQGI